MQNDVYSLEQEESGSQKCRIKGRCHSSSHLVNQTFHFFSCFYKILNRKHFIPRLDRMFCTGLNEFLVFFSGGKHKICFGLIHTKFVSSRFWLENWTANPQLLGESWCVLLPFLTAVSVGPFHLSGIKKTFFLSSVWIPSKCVSFFSLSLKNEKKDALQKMIL